MNNNFFNINTANLKTNQSFKIVFFLVWVLISLYLASKHVFWRDEVRAFSLAIHGNNLSEFFSSLKGEGHPALWYILLRVANGLFNSPISLPITAFLIAFLSFLLLVFRSPFNLFLIALILMSKFALYEYTVMARNYGISMLILFVIAVLYEKYRYQGIVIGLLLFLLANCNVHSVLLVGSFLVFWFLDIVLKPNENMAAQMKVFLINGFIAAIGIVVCFMTIYPPFNDAAVVNLPNIVTFKMVINTLLLPSHNLPDLAPIFRSEFYPALSNIWPVVSSFILFGSTLILIKRPSAFIAVCIALFTFTILFEYVYPGGYRHQALWLVFLISLYWIIRADTKHDIKMQSFGSISIKTIQQVGYVFLILLLTIQVWTGLIKTVRRAVLNVKESHSYDLGELVNSKPELSDAIIIASPEYLVESLPYYINNPTYLIREKRFGKVVFFTKNAILRLSLDDILVNAQKLKKEYKKPIIILLNYPLVISDKAKITHEGYNWQLEITPIQTQAFLKKTKLLASFDPEIPGENFDVYLLK